MSKYKDKHRNISIIIHNLKEEYSKKFGKKMPLSYEPMLNMAAKLVKEGRYVEWQKTKEGNEILKQV